MSGPNATSTGGIAPAPIIRYSNCPVPNGLLAAQASGALTGAGIDLHVLTGEEGITHFSYDHPAYTRFGGEIPPLVSEGLRAPGRTRLLGVSVLAPRQGFYASQAGRLRAPADLSSHRVGVSGAAIRILTGQLGDYRELSPWHQTLIALGSWEARALLRTLEAGGLALSDVELVRIDNPWVDVPEARRVRASSVRASDLFLKVAKQQGALLESGHVDALFSWLPWAPELEDCAGARLLVDLSTDPRNHFASTWTVSSELVERQPELVQRLVDAVVDSARWATEHGLEVTQIHARDLGVSEAAVRRGFGEHFHRHLLPTLDTPALAVLEQTQAFLVEHWLLDRPVNLARWAAPEFLARSVERIQPSRSVA